MSLIIEIPVKFVDDVEVGGVYSLETTVPPAHHLPDVISVLSLRDFIEFGHQFDQPALVVFLQVNMDFRSVQLHLVVILALDLFSRLPNYHLLNHLKVDSEQLDSSVETFGVECAPPAIVFYFRSVKLLLARIVAIGLVGNRSLQLSDFCILLAFDFHLVVLLFFAVYQLHKRSCV